MKEFHELLPVVVIGGVAGAFLGEYMAGGILIVLGLDNSESCRLSDRIVPPVCTAVEYSYAVRCRRRIYRSI